MSLYHETGLPENTDSTAARFRVKLPKEVTVALTKLLPEAKHGLLSLSVAIRLQVLQAMIDEKVAAVAGAKGKHDPMRTAYRHGFESRTVTLGGRKLSIMRPRVRTLAGREVTLETPA